MNIIIFEGKSSFNEYNESNITYTSTRDSDIPFDEWSMWRGDSNNTGNVSSIGPSTWNLLWGTAPKSNSFSSPAVKYGHVYIGRGASIYCYDVATGNTLWFYNLSSDTSSTPLIFKGRVYIGSGSELFCLDANGTGGTTTKYWTAPIGATVDSSPTTDGDDDIFIASGNGQLKAIYTNGTQHWSSPVNSGTASSPAYWNGRVYVGGGGWTGGDRNIYCFNSDTGEQIWSYTLDSTVCGSPALAYGNVYIPGSGDVGGTGEFGNIYCLDAIGSGGTTTEIWKYDIGGTFGSAAVGYGRVYIGSADANFYCLDAFGNGTGGTTLYWKKHIDDWSYSSPIITPKFVFTGAADGMLYCLDRADSSTVWSRKLGSGKTGLWGISSSPALAGNLLFVTNDGAGLHCIGAKKDTEPPEVFNTVPVSNATEVSSDIEINIVFDKPVDPSTISEASVILEDFLGQPVSCSVRSNWIGDTAYLKPDNPLKKNEIFTVTITTAIEDFVGFHLDGDRDGKDEGAGIDEYTFSFKTAIPYPPFIDPIPTQRPTEKILFELDLSTYITDQDTSNEKLTIEVNSSHISVEGLVLHMRYPDGITTEVVNISVRDGDFPTPTFRDLVVEVITINDPPELTAVPPQILYEDIPFELDMSQYITDLDTPFSNITLEDNSSYAEIDGLIINFTYPDGLRSDLVNVSVYDGNNTEYLDIPVIISAVNDAPEITEIPPAEVDAGVPFKISLEDYISDIDNPQQDLVITVDSPYIEVEGHFLNLTYPDGVTKDTVDVTVSDGQLVDSTTLTVKIVPSGKDDNGIGELSIGLVLSALLGAVVLIIIVAVVFIKPTKMDRKNEAKEEKDNGHGTDDGMNNKGNEVSTEEQNKKS